jgi:hypothetical protein
MLAGDVAVTGDEAAVGEPAPLAEDGAADVAAGVLAADAGALVAPVAAVLVAAAALDVTGEQPATAIQTPTPTAGIPVRASRSARRRARETSAGAIPLNRANFIVIPVRLVRHGHP